MNKETLMDCQITDFGLAQYFSSLRPPCVWDTEKKYWRVWDGKCWQKDKEDAVRLHLLNKVIRPLIAKAEQIDDEKVRSHILAVLKRYQSSARISAILREAQPLLCHGEFDADPFLLNCQNGILDLRCGVLMPHDPEKFCSKIAACVYDPDARHPRWEQFLNEITGGDVEYQRFLQKVFGYSLTGSTVERAYFCVFGEGVIEAELLVGVARRLMGDYALSDFNTSIIMRHNIVSRADAPFLKKARLSIAPNGIKWVRPNFIFATFAKSFLFVRDTPYEEFIPIYKLFFIESGLPQFDRLGARLLQHMIPLPFKRKFLEFSQEIQLQELFLDQAAPAIFRWMVEGCLLWQKENLTIAPDVVLDAMHRIRTNKKITV